MFTIKMFCGGDCQTNGYAIDCPGGTVVIDAPEGMLDWLKSVHLTPKALLLTHLHFDHVLDAAAIAEEFDCPVFARSALTPELHLGDLIAQLTGMSIAIPHFELREPLEGKSVVTVAETDFELLHVPGHSPDSLCFYLPDQGILFAGDTLFQSGIGRSDFPGGDESLLINGIREKLLTLPPECRVYPGHGGDTTVEIENATNPFLR